MIIQNQFSNILSIRDQTSNNDKIVLHPTSNPAPVGSIPAVSSFFFCSFITSNKSAGGSGVILT